MHDELRVGVRHWIEHPEKQVQSLSQRQLARGAVAIDALARHVLENQVRLPVLADAGIEQPGDGRVREPRQQARFVSDLLGSIPPETPTVEQLDGYAALELAIAATRQPHAPHPAATEQGFTAHTT